jgi:hypothetical protein
MSQLVCPLCGRFVGVKHFDPRFFEDDIYGVEVRGLGRGRGFEVTDRYSLLDDPAITGLIADRCHRILHLINNKGYIPPQELDALRATLDSWIQYARRLEAENTSLREENEELSEVDDKDGYELNRLLQKINRDVNFDFDDLEEAIDFLLEN